MYENTDSMSTFVYFIERLHGLLPAGGEDNDRNQRGATSPRRLYLIGTGTERLYVLVRTTVPVDLLIMFALKVNDPPELGAIQSR